MWSHSRSAGAADYGYRYLMNKTSSCYWVMAVDEMFEASEESC